MEHTLQRNLSATAMVVSSYEKMTPILAMAMRETTVVMLKLTSGLPKGL